MIKRFTRTIAGGAIASGRTQYLTWDGAGRLVRVVQDEFGGSGFEWSAVYDGFNRRLQTLYTPKVNGVLTAAQQVRERSWYDPSVEFLEVGIEVFKATSNTTERWWKVHGPDLSGGYGGLQGMGGLEAVINEQSGQAVGMVDDAYGHILGFAKAATGSGGSLAPNNLTSNPSGSTFPTAANQIYFEWHSARFTGYGPQAGNWSPSIEEGVAVWRTFGWRGKRMEVTGFYHLGARYYEPNSGRFLSPDPMGHGASMGLYDYAGGDPVNFVDPRGRKAGVAFSDGSGTTETVYNTVWNGRIDPATGLKIWDVVAPLVGPPTPAPLVGPPLPIPPYVGQNKTSTMADGLIIDKNIPGDATIILASGVAVYAPPSASIQKIYDAGVSNSIIGLGSVGPSVGHYGTFDFQRNGGQGKQPTNYFYPAYTDASNVAVGVYMAGAGYSWWQTKTIAGGFAHMFSSNAGVAAQESMWQAGWNAAQSMKPSPGVTPIVPKPYVPPVLPLGF